MSELKWPYEFPGVYWLGNEEQDVVIDVLRNGSLFRYYGLNKPSYVDKFERLAQQFYKTQHALAVNSGTGALITALKALRIGPGCEVIVPAFMWIATVGSIVQVNAIPVLTEVDESFSMDPLCLEKKITKKTKLIIPVHMAGTPCNMKSIMEIANKYNIPVLEDVAQCNGGSFNGKKTGTFGEIGMFSLQLNKNMTCGDGGLIITNDKKLSEKCIAAHDLGLNRVKGRLVEPEDDVLNWGGGRRMSELNGAVASVQIKKLPRIIEKMKKSKERIKSMLTNAPGISFRKMNDSEGDTGTFLIIILEDEQKAISVVEKMKKEGMHNVCRVAEYGLHIYYNMTPLVKKVALSAAGNPWSLEENRDSNYEYVKGTCPVSDSLFSRSIIIPIPSSLSKEQEEQAAKIITMAVKSYC